MKIKNYKKAKLLTDTLCPDFYYHVLEIKNGNVRLGWTTRRDTWNETTVPVSDVEFAED